MRIFSRLRITALAAATVTALAIGACATDEDLVADPTAADDSALIQADQVASPDEAPAAQAGTQAVACALSLSASCPCSGTFARCEGEATGGNGANGHAAHTDVPPARSKRLGKDASRRAESGDVTA